MATASATCGAKLGSKGLPLPQKGSAGMGERTEKALKSGIALSQMDMDKIILAKDAMPKLKKVFEGFENKLTVAGAPVIELFGQVFEKFMPYITGFVDGAARGLAVYWAV